jgi:iron complex outermembrane receptor protein
MVYGTVATGTKGGGFDARFLRTNDSPFFEYDEETAINYEVGVKSSLLSGLMTLNAAAFFTTVEDYQVSIFDGATAFFVQNAAEVESKGVEVEVQWAPTERLRVNFAGTYLDATYAEFPQRAVLDPVGLRARQPRQLRGHRHADSLPRCLR